MQEQKFDPELVPEMDWSDCILSASIRNESENYSTWICAACGDDLVLYNSVSLVDTAEAFIKNGWRYRRTHTGMDALCDKCRTHKK